MISRNKLNQAGDTIVEVLIAIGILSMILGASYAVAIKSSRSVRDAQERTEAQKIAMGSLELFRVKAKDNPSEYNAPVKPSVFCFDSTGSKIVIASLPPLDAPSSSYNPDCDQKTQSSDPVSYHVLFERSSVDLNIFTVYVRWESGAGKSTADNNQVRFSYRIEL